MVLTRERLVFFDTLIAYKSYAGYLYIKKKYTWFFTAAENSFKCNVALMTFLISILCNYFIVLVTERNIPF